MDHLPENDSPPVRIAPGKQMLMEAATRLAARQGSVHTLVLREVAREAGFNHNTFYRHFDSLEDMMHTVVQGFGQELAEGLRQMRFSVPPGQPLTPAVVGWLFDFALRHGDVFTVAMREQYGPPGPIRDAVRGMLIRLREDMGRDLIALGVLPQADAARLQRMLHIIVTQVFQLCLDVIETPRRRDELLAAAQEMFETLMAGAAVLAPRARA